VNRYRPVIAPTARKELDRLPTNARERVVRAIDALSDNPRPHGSLKLEGGEGQYRIRVGKYRVIYSIEDDVLIVLIVRVRHRKDAYR
jgi:mRNA interferase RelE/StbE